VLGDLAICEAGGHELSEGSSDFVIAAHPLAGFSEAATRRRTPSACRRLRSLAASLVAPARANRTRASVSASIPESAIPCPWCARPRSSQAAACASNRVLRSNRPTGSDNSPGSPSISALGWAAIGSSDGTPGENSARRSASATALSAPSRSPTARAIRTNCGSSAVSIQSRRSTCQRSWPVAQSHR
jgi:hypothetical protein